ncbi:MAG: polysaccharide biosynthesis protein [Eubacteriales bacterium]|nr:polysaccharide biosynthesis protein [Eubacteriales bacterium]
MNETKKNTGSNYLVQGSILAAAGIIVRLIGLLYKIPMTRILGNEGIGYYNTAYEIYNIGLILSSYSLPLAVSKLIAKKEEEGLRGDAGRVFRCGIAVGVVTGGLMTALLLFGANHIASVIFNSPGSALPLKVMAPTILVFAVMGVFRGYFQGHGNMIPTSVSQIIEQVVHAAVSIWASYDFMRRFAAADNPASYGAAGGTLGTLIGALAAFLLLAVLMIQERDNRRMEAGMEAESDYSQIMKLLLLTFAPIILSQFVYQLSGSVDNSMFGLIMGGKGYSEKERMFLLGIYGGKYRLLTNVPVAIASSLGASMIPSIVMSRVRGEKSGVQDKIYMTIKFNMLLAIPCACGMFFLASPLMRFIFGDGTEMTGQILMMGASAVIFFSLSTVTNAVLQGIDLMRKSVTHSAISLGIHVVLVYIMLEKLELGVYGLVIGNVTFALVVCILNWRAIGKTLSYRQEVKTTFLLPLIASVLMGAAARGIYEGVHALLHSNAAAVLCAAACGAVLYGVLLMLMHAVTEEELKKMPLGRTILRLGRVIRR